MATTEVIDKRVIEIADYLWADPSKKRGDVVQKYSKKWGRSENTIDRILAKAKEYNKQRTGRLEEKRAEVLVNREIEVVKSSVTTRERILEIMNDLAEGIPQEIVIGYDDEGNRVYKAAPVMPQDRIRAANVILEVEGWKAPVETVSKVRISTEDIPEEEKQLLLKIARKMQR